MKLLIVRIGIASKDELGVMSMDSEWVKEIALTDGLLGSQERLAYIVGAHAEALAEKILEGATTDA